MAYKNKYGNYGGLEDEDGFSSRSAGAGLLAGKLLTDDARQQRDEGVRASYAARPNAYDQALAEEQAYTAALLQEQAAAPRAPVTVTDRRTKPPIADAQPAAGSGGTNSAGLTPDEIRQVQSAVSDNGWDFGPGSNPSDEARAWAALYAPNDYARWLASRGESPDAGGNQVAPAAQGGTEAASDPLRERILAMIDGYDSREPFSYDPETDPLYSVYRKQYTREGRRASEDVLGQYAAMTGGMPSTAAVTAAQQAGDYYAAQMTDKIPELYRLAYQIWGDEGDKRLQTISLLRGLYADDYERSRDAVSDARYADELAYKRSRDAKADADDDYERQLERAQMLAELGDSSALYELLGYTPAAEETPAYTGGGSYSNGGLTDAQVREMQKYYGATADGKWGSNSRAAAGGRSAKEAWDNYVKATGGTGGSGGDDGWGNYDKASAYALGLPRTWSDETLATYIASQSDIETYVEDGKIKFRWKTSGGRQRR